ncbi:MAG: DNA-protecting protein DprA [Candidatus Coatesbacteria bacterium]|nr:MAG: DNA-protecting protein DprA [Candidatus Coatesbacteria bacterium]
MTEDMLWLALGVTLRTKRVTFTNLINNFETIERVFDASARQLCCVKGVSMELAGAIKRAPESDEFKTELDAVQRLGLKIVTIRSPDYPENLRHIADPPQLLYVKGRLEPQDSFAIAIVGTRTVTHYGRQTAKTLGADLASMGITVVSGLARGVDASAHMGALTGKGRTIAVLGSGHGKMYPAEHASLAEEIARAGAVISELRTDTEPMPGNFPVRNRIISGLSLGTVVVEAGKRSGALITARLALEHGREVFAVPGNINAEMSAGPNLLIQQGAKPVLSASDIIAEIAPELKGMMKEGTVKQAAEAKLKLTPEERKVYEMLTQEPQHIDEIILSTALPTPTVSTTLFNLEIKGLAKEMPGKLFVRTL